MNCLIDTVVLLWALSGHEENISKKASKIMEEEALVLSAASLWEIAIKYSVEKLDMEDNPQRWLPEMILKMGIQQLAISHRHALGVTDLPLHHKDPFDRLLISQAKLEEMPILTPDKIFKKYKVETVW